VDATGTERHVDVVIMATGFHVADFLTTLQVEGEHGLSLKQYWGEEPWAFLGMTVPGFPNFVMMYGPNTNGVPSIISYHEVQADTIVRMAKRLRRPRSAWLETRPGIARRADEWTQRQLATHLSAATAGCHNYNLAPTGRNVSQWPRSHNVYRLAVAILLPLGIRSAAP
jgi:cation diffusion facilitator CzcD-associated flavoprotein CzcO